MKTYSTKVHIQRLAAFLCVNGKPFRFDGSTIEFAATEDFIRAMKEGDRTLAVINFKTED